MTKGSALTALSVTAVGLVIGMALFVTQPRADDALAAAVVSRPSRGAAEAFSAAGIAADRVCVFGPYSTDDAIAAQLGFWLLGASEQTGIRNSDSHELVVAAAPGHVVAWAMVPRGSGSALIGGGPYRCAPVP